jgi:hypothetical protein
MQWARVFGFVSMQKVMQLNAESYEIFESSKQLHYILNGCEVCGMFKSLGQLQGGVMDGYAKLSVNNIIDIEKEPMKGVQVNSNGLKRKGGCHVHTLWFPKSTLG